MNNFYSLKKKDMLRAFCVFVALTGIFLRGEANDFEPLPEGVMQRALAGAEQAYRLAGDPPAPNLSARTLFDIVLAYLETGQFTERLPHLLQLAAQMQDRNPQHSTYGNFRWYWRDEKVGDWNAVDFCMQTAALIELRHGRQLEAAIRPQWDEIIECAIEGLLRHVVPVDYTNIVFMNAGNLILWGELKQRPQLIEEGRARFEEALAYTCRYGTHEYDSPTYYGVDMNNWGMLVRYCRDEKIRQQAETLLRYIWTDIAAHWHPGAQRLCGTHSRSYDYVKGLGFIDMPLRAAGWLQTPTEAAPDLFSYLVRWEPPAAFLSQLRALAARLPRLVEQTWGPNEAEFKVHYLQSEITLSTSGCAYVDLTDMPLTIDWPAERGEPRGYFIADGRHDPYGKKPFAIGIHAKALHLPIFWAGQQRKTDAVGLAVYTERALSQPDVSVLESNIVLPRVADSWHIGDTQVVLDGQKAVQIPVPLRVPVVLRRRGAALGIKVLAARDVAGLPASVFLVDEPGPIPCVRLVVRHHKEGQPLSVAEAPMAAFWLRMGNGLKEEAAFRRWQERFQKAAGTARLSVTSAEIRVAGEEGALGLHAEAPWGQKTIFMPAPSRQLLAINKKDLGRAILQPMCKRLGATGIAKIAPLILKAGQAIFWEAESGLVRLLMAVAEDANASGGKFIWLPGEPGQIGPSGGGHVTWRLRVPRAGRYWLWGRVLTPTPTEDSFFISAFTEKQEIMAPIEWHTGVYSQWAWTPLTKGPAQEACPLDLPAGDVFIRCKAREDGAKLDRLFLTPKADEKPHD